MLTPGYNFSFEVLKEIKALTALQGSELGNRKRDLLLLQAPQLFLTGNCDLPWTQRAAEQRSPGAGVSLGRAPTPASDSLSRRPGSRQRQPSNALCGPRLQK